MPTKIPRSKVLAVIPARGGSKGIRRKNLALFLGEPLIGRAIRTALRARSVGTVWVSTDDREIAEAARRYGAGVIRRPAGLSGDKASSEAALLHALGHLSRGRGLRHELLVFLQCTSPLALPEDIDAAVEALIRSGADTVLTAAPFHGFVWRVSGGAAVGVNHDQRERKPRQDIEPQYVETGAVYVMRVKGFLRSKHRFFGKTVLHVTPPERAVDVDSPHDLRLAEALHGIAARERPS